MKTKTALLIIDAQNDFTDPKGSLYVPGAEEDIQRASDFILRNKIKIDKIFASFDVHSPMQIFHSKWWKNTETNECVEPFSAISLQDVESGKIVPVIEEDWSKHYLESLEKKGRFKHTIWPNHCILGTWGQQLNEKIKYAVENWQESKDHSVYMDIINKGWNPLTEFFGIFKSEVSVDSDISSLLNYRLIIDLLGYDKIYTFGEAKSHCFGISIEQILDLAENSDSKAQELLSKVVIISDCCSDIPGFEGAKDDVIERAKKYGLTTQTSDFKIE